MSRSSRELNGPFGRREGFSAERRRLTGHRSRTPLLLEQIRLGTGCGGGRHLACFLVTQNKPAGRFVSRKNGGEKTDGMWNIRADDVLGCFSGGSEFI